MGGIGGEQEAADAQLLGAALVDLVGAEVDDLVLVWVGGAGHKGLVFGGQALAHLLVGQVGVFAVCDAEQAVFGQLRNHWGGGRCGQLFCLVLAWERERERERRRTGKVLWVNLEGRRCPAKVFELGHVYLRVPSVGRWHGEHGGRDV